MSEVEIQCPECGGMLKRKYPMVSRIWKCSECGKHYTEEDIRERCGI